MERSPALYRYDLPRSPISAVPMALCRTRDSLLLLHGYAHGNSDATEHRYDA